MRKLTVIALAAGLMLAGCGGGTQVKPATASSTTTSTPTSVATTSTSSATTPPATSGSPTATGTRSSATGLRTPAPTSTGAPSGGAGTAPSSGPSPGAVRKARAAYPLCKKERPGITLAELEREADSPEGIQC